jgi:sulfite reductase alpha subunit-like flavoprotein
MIYIYYGSQSGTCEYLSFNLKSTLEEKYKLDIVCDSLNNFDFSPEIGSLHMISGGLTEGCGSLRKTSIKNNENIVIIITSTHGNGDSPENAAQFWRHIKNRKLNNEYFKNMKYIILGLGDSNYENYCGFAKKIDKRLLDLNSSKIYDTFYIDSVLNETEEQFDIWVRKIIEVLNV